jgi:hypothetical protein
VSVPTSRAEPTVEYVGRRDADRLQLPAICFGQIDFARTYERIPFGEVGRELSGDIRSHFIAAAADARANRDVKIRRRGSKIRFQLAHCCLRYLGGSAAPARMNGGNGAPVIVQNQQGNTIGCSDGDALSNAICDQSVTFALPIGKTSSIPHNVRMDLPQGNVCAGISQPGTKAVLLPGEGFEGLAAVNTVITKPKVAAQIAPTRSRDFFEARSARYQSRVRRRPSSKVKRGACPSSFTAAVVSAWESRTSPALGGP